MTAQDIMIRQVITVKANVSIKDAIKFLVNIEISGLVVVDDNNKAIGVVTEKDLIVAYDMLGNINGPINDFVNRDVIFVEETSTVKEIYDIFLQNNIKRVPVLRDGEVVGIISRRDILRALLKEAAN
ncbi:MAG: CBS domain-containing protein [Candidatus Omnitrophica bacterium]|nr:CBS domain-containing protein [Candidatus Omnitrophota bacterium]